MIESLTIDGYKSIRHQLVPLKKLNVLAGLNSSGKSSVIQALEAADSAIIVVGAVSALLYMLINNYIYPYILCSAQ